MNGLTRRVVLIIYGSLAQSGLERLPVKQDVAGSKPAGAATSATIHDRQDLSKSLKGLITITCPSSSAHRAGGFEPQGRELESLLGYQLNYLTKR